MPYIGEIRLIACNYPPVGWAFCDGQELPISENDALYVVLGTTYGGDGQSTFCLPDMRGRVPVHQQANVYQLGERAGVEEVTLTVNQIPSHTHTLLCTSGLATDPNPQDNVRAEQTGVSGYFGAPPAIAYSNMAPTSIGPVGGSQPHSNLQPYTCINFIISLYGVYPQPS